MKRSGHDVQSATKLPTIPRGALGTQEREGTRTFAFAFFHVRGRKRRVSPRLRFKDWRASVAQLRSGSRGQVTHNLRHVAVAADPQISRVTSYRVYVNGTIPFKVDVESFFFQNNSIRLTKKKKKRKPPSERNY